MIIEPKITIKDFPHSEAITTRIQERVAKLDQFYSRITACRVTIEQSQRRHHQGKLFNVKIDLTVPGSEIVVNRDEHEDPYVVIRDAFDALERKLESYARKQRGEVKAHVEVPLGRVTKLFSERGYGFIETTDGRELYFHRNSVLEPDFESLQIGSAVAFLEEQGNKGPQATRIVATREHVSA